MAANDGGLALPSGLGCNQRVESVFDIVALARALSPKGGTRTRMANNMFDHERLDVYRVSLEFVSWAYTQAQSLKGPDRHARDQLLRASQSIPLNIAEGNGKLPSPDRLKSLRIALGSALECAAVLDVLRVCGAMGEDASMAGKRLLERIVAMLTRMARMNAEMKDEAFEYECEYECDPERPREPGSPPNAVSSRR
ncbi:MAG: four helix bundle protein [Limisphaerales bacterium]